MTKDTDQIVRKLAAILSTDVKEYSRLMGDDEMATVEAIIRYRSFISEFVEFHRGRVVDSQGDNLLAEFASAVDALNCAVAIQEKLALENQSLEDHRKMEFRIGINVGDVITQGERLFVPLVLLITDAGVILSLTPAITNTGQVTFDSSTLDAFAESKRPTVPNRGSDASFGSEL